MVNNETYTEYSSHRRFFGYKFGTGKDFSVKKIIKDLCSLAELLPFSEVERQKAVLDRLGEIVPVYFLHMLSDSVKEAPKKLTLLEKFESILDPRISREVEFYAKSNIHSKIHSVDFDAGKDPGRYVSRRCMRCDSPAHRSRECTVYQYSTNLCSTCKNFKGVNLYHSQDECKLKSK